MLAAKNTIELMRPLINSVLVSTPSIISMWANLLAIFAAITITGLINISVEPTVQILQPTYLVGKQCLQKVLSDSRYRFADSLTNRIFKDKSILLVDVPVRNALFVRSSGEPITSRFLTTDSTYFEYREMADGLKILRSSDPFLDPESELKEGVGWTFEGDLPKASQEALSPVQKRVQVMPFFTHLMSTMAGTYRQTLTTDSLSDIESEFQTVPPEPPLILMSALFDCRKVFTTVCIENNSAYDINDLQMQVYKRRSYSSDDRLKLEAWTIDESQFEFDTEAGRKISIHIPRLSAKSSIQLVISSLASQIKDQDLALRYEKLRNLDRTIVGLVVVATFVLSAMCRFKIERSVAGQSGKS